MKYSIIISTKNRSDKLIRCVSSIKKNTFRNYEIIVIDQSSANHNCTVNKLSNVRYYAIPGCKSEGVNYALVVSKGKIIVFLDDDCLVDESWLFNLNTVYLKNPGIQGVFGNTYPYMPTKRADCVCPATFVRRRIIVSDPYMPHFKVLGHGNNMSFRRSVFCKVGLFKTWLGVGSITLAGGIESEFIFRCLLYKNSLLHEPSVRVYHDRWISTDEEQLLQGRYFCGDSAFVSYYLIRGYIRVLELLLFRMQLQFIPNVFRFVTALRYKQMKGAIKYGYYFFWYVYCIMRGVLIGVVMSVVPSGTSKFYEKNLS